MAIVIMPLRDLYIEYFIVKLLNFLEVVDKLSLELIKVLGILWSLGTSKVWHDLLRSFSGELKLTFTDLHEILASLDEGLILSEDSLIGIEIPILSG